MSNTQDTTNGERGDCVHCGGVMAFTWQPGHDATLECPDCHHCEAISAIVADVLTRRLRQTYRRRLLAEASDVCRALIDQQAAGHDERRQGIIIGLMSVVESCGAGDAGHLRQLLEAA